MQIKSEKIKLTALRDQQARENPKPLTLEELYQVEDEPLYLFCTVGNWKVNGWHIVKPVNYLDGAFKDLQLDNNESNIIDTFNYGKTWLAYRQKPKEAK